MSRLREVRVIKRITQFQLRLLTGIHQSKISLIENGPIEPYDDEKKRIVEALGVKVVEILVESYTINEGGITWNKIDGYYLNVNGAASVVRNRDSHGIPIILRKWPSF